MLHLEYEKDSVDKSEWGPGPWQDEPDFVVWVHTPSKYPCIAVRQPDLGHWCGYVGLPTDHPLTGRGYFHVDVAVHGRLTYGKDCILADPSWPSAWWFGFDCGHIGDTLPGFETFLPGTDNPKSGTYRDLSYVMAELERLAIQLALVLDPLTMV